MGGRGGSRVTMTKWALPRLALVTLALGACATTGAASGPLHRLLEDPVAAASLSSGDDVRQCILLEQALDSSFKHAQIRVHVSASGIVETVAVQDRPYLSECLKRAFLRRGAAA